MSNNKTQESANLHFGQTDGKAIVGQVGPGMPQGFPASCSRDQHEGAAGNPPCSPRVQGAVILAFI